MSSSEYQQQQQQLRTARLFQQPTPTVVTSTPNYQHSNQLQPQPFISSAPINDQHQFTQPIQSIQPNYINPNITTAFQAQHPQAPQALTIQSGPHRPIVVSSPYIPTTSTSTTTHQGEAISNKLLRNLKKKWKQALTDLDLANQARTALCTENQCLKTEKKAWQAERKAWQKKEKEWEATKKEWGLEQRAQDYMMEIIRDVDFDEETNERFRVATEKWDAEKREWDAEREERQEAGEKEER